MHVPVTFHSLRLVIKKSHSTRRRGVVVRLVVVGTLRTATPYLLLPLRRRRIRDTTSSSPSTATWMVVGGRTLTARARTITSVPSPTRSSCARSIQSSSRLSSGCLVPRSPGATSVPVWNGAPWGDATRAANASPLFCSLFRSSFVLLYVPCNRYSTSF